MLKIFFTVVQFLPLKSLSFIVGLLSRIELPIFLRKIIYGIFSWIYNANPDEAQHEISEYPTFVSFFTRELKPDSRKIEDGVVSPVDGTLFEFGQIEEGSLLQAKGVDYNLDSLLIEPALVSLFKSGSYATFYLAPGDYHHIHSPVNATVTQRLYIPGSLLPVGKLAVKYIYSLYCTNERVISILRTDKSSIAVIKVGATNVGSIGLTYEPEFHSDLPRALDHKIFENGVSISKGEKLGTFYLGSTVIVLSEDKIDFHSDLHKFLKIKYGNSISVNSI